MSERGINLTTSHGFHESVWRASRSAGLQVEEGTQPTRVVTILMSSSIGAKRCSTCLSFISKPGGRNTFYFEGLHRYGNPKNRWNGIKTYSPKS